AQCSTLMCLPYMGWYALATSPAANTSGAELRSPASTMTPLPTSRPASVARPVDGIAPMPTTTWSAGSTAPEEVTAALTFPPEPWNAVTDSLVRNTTPCSLCRLVNTSPSSGPSCRYSATGSGSTRVTSQPASLAAAVTSSPIHPPPTV